MRLKASHAIGVVVDLTGQTAFYADTEQPIAPQFKKTDLDPTVPLVPVNAR